MLKDPLFHFALLGALVFGAWHTLHPSAPSDEPRTIVVDRDALLTFIQYRSRSFDEPAAARRLDAWPPAVVEDLVNQYIREEALHRSAIEMGLDADDYVIRQRLVQKVEYMADGVGLELATPGEAELEAWYAARRGDYLEPATVTFTHVFFSTARHGRDGALGLAVSMRNTLNRERVTFEQAPGFGERFAYHVNYVQRSREAVASHFGDALAATLFSLAPDVSLWHGPFESPLGAHVVLLTRAEPERLPALADLRETVVRDWLAEAARARKDAFIADVVAGFTVIRDPDLQRTPAS